MKYVPAQKRWVEVGAVESTGAASSNMSMPNAARPAGGRGAVGAVQPVVVQTLSEIYDQDWVSGFGEGESDAEAEEEQGSDGSEHVSAASTGAVLGGPTGGAAGDEIGINAVTRRRQEPLVDSGATKTVQDG